MTKTKHKREIGLIDLKIREETLIEINDLLDKAQLGVMEELGLLDFIKQERLYYYLKEE